MTIERQNVNFAYSTLFSDMTLAATTMTLPSGETSRFPQSYPFIAVIWGSAFSSPMLDPSRELVLVTAINSGVYAVTRAQESTSAKAWPAGANVGHFISAGTIDEIVTEIETLEGTGLPPASIDPTVHFNTGSGAVTLASGGANQNVTVLNSGTGRVAVKTTTDNTTSFQVQKSSGLAILNADTTNSRIGINTNTPGAALEIIKTTEQLRLSYDATHYTGLTVNSAGDLSIKWLTTNVAITDAFCGWISIPITATPGFMTYTSADDPTFVASLAADVTSYVSVGMKMKLTQSATIKYFIITAITANSITLYGGTDYDLANEDISAVYFSPHKEPHGFPMNPTKWTVEITDNTQRSQANPAANTWYNLGTQSITIPIGIWDVSFVAVPMLNVATGATVRLFAALSTTNNGRSDEDLSAYLVLTYANGDYFGQTVSRRKFITLASKTVYYLNTMVDQTVTGGTVYNDNNNARAVMRAVCAYL